MKRYNLSGIYIFDQFEGEERRQPTCIEDCNDATRQAWLESLDKTALINTINHLCHILHIVAEQTETRVKGYEND